MLRWHRILLHRRLALLRSLSVLDELLLRSLNILPRRRCVLLRRYHILMHRHIAWPHEEHYLLHIILFSCTSTQFHWIGVGVEAAAQPTGGCRAEQPNPQGELGILTREWGGSHAGLQPMYVYMYMLTTPPKTDLRV